MNLKPMQTFTPGSEADWELANSFKTVRHLEWYDGPLLTEREAGDGSLWLFKWCDCDDTAHRWLATPVSEKEIEAYMAQEISLFELGKKPAFTYKKEVESDTCGDCVFFNGDEKECIRLHSLAYIDDEMCDLGYFIGKGTYLLIDIGDDVVNVWRTEILPDDYLPQVDVLHDEDLELDD